MAGSRKLIFELRVALVLSAIFICSPVASQNLTCGPTQNVLATGLVATASTATLQWILQTDFPSACVQQLVVCWSSPGPDSTTCQTLPPTATSLVMTGLQPCTAYSMRVTVKPLNGTSATTTFSTTTSAGSAENVSVLWLSASSLRVSWQYNAGQLNCVSRFLAAVCDTSNQTLTACQRYPVPLAAGVTNYSVAVVGQEPCRVYHVRVVVETTLLNSAPVNSPEIPFYLDGVSVATFNATEVGVTAMRVAWTLPHAVNASCQHNLTACAVPVADGRQRCAANVASPTTAVNITNLRPCSAYQLQLRLATPTGEIVAVGPVLPTYSTDRRLVSSLQLTRSRDQVLAHWVPLIADPACAKGYRVCWNETTGAACEDTAANVTSFTILELDSGNYVVEVAGIFFDDSLSTPVTQVARISAGTARMFISPIVLVLAVAAGKVLQMT